MKKKTKLLIILIVLSGAIAFDNFWISKHIAFLSNILRMEFILNIPGLQLPTSKFGLIPVFIITMLCYILIELPYGHLKDQFRRRVLYENVQSVLIGIVLLPMFMIIGAILYNAFEWFFPVALNNFAKTWTVTMNFYLFNSDSSPIKLDGSLGTLLGLVVGVVLLNKKIK
jgi:hypothetical protein